MARRNALEDLFLDAHRSFVQGLKRVLERLRADDVSGAIAAAGELDVVAGPHIEFEETVFYPLLVDSLGRESVDQLYREHAAGLNGLRRLLGCEDPSTWTSADERVVTEQFQAALDHATSCGALLSHVAALDDEATSRILALHRQIEARHPRWTELHRRSPAKDGSRSSS